MSRCDFRKRLSRYICNARKDVGRPLFVETRCVPSPSFDEIANRGNVRADKIRTWNGGIERDPTAVNPGNRQPQRLAADQIGELRLPAMQDFVRGGASGL